MNSQDLASPLYLATSTQHQLLTKIHSLCKKIVKAKNDIQLINRYVSSPATNVKDITMI